MNSTVVITDTCDNPKIPTSLLHSMNGTQTNPTTGDTNEFYPYKQNGNNWVLNQDMSGFPMGKHYDVCVDLDGYIRCDKIDYPSTDQ